MDQKQKPLKSNFIAPHIESFDALFGYNGVIEHILKDLCPCEVWDGEINSSNKLKLQIEEITVSKPHNEDNTPLYPFEARERLIDYSGNLFAKIKYKINDGISETFSVNLGKIPIMVKSSKCNLRSISHKYEDQDEQGGYFIANGIEYLVRLLVVPRQNYAIGIVRDTFKNKGQFYSKYGVQMRCVRPDKSSQTNTIHYLSNGGITLRFNWRKNEYMVPIILIMKALIEVSDKEIFLALAKGNFQNAFLTDNIELLLRGSKNYKVDSSSQCCEYLGSKFRIVLDCPPNWTNKQVGDYFLHSIVLVHLQNYQDKFRMLICMMQKLYALVAGEFSEDNPDSPSNHDVLVPGFLYGMIIKEKLNEMLRSFRTIVNHDASNNNQRNYTTRKDKISFATNPQYIPALFKKKVNCDIGSKLTYFIKTGNVISVSGLDLQQTTSFSININSNRVNYYGYLSQFRSIHRGKFFTEVRSTSVRKLLPEAWGFICPVHTPDGGNCGLLNHLTHQCYVICQKPNVAHIPSLLSNFGMTPSFDMNPDTFKLQVQLDGKLIGWATPHQVQEMAHSLRIFKTTGQHNVPLGLEIGLVPVGKHGGQYPGLYLFSDTSRMMRPVKYLFNNQNDLVGSFEQVYMNVAVRQDEIIEGLSSHVEHSPTHSLSLLANLTPFSDFNQSPRNIYQCQMAKQTMGTPSISFSRRTDNAIYRLHTPQGPIVRTKLFDDYNLVDAPQGTNAIVAVISYTGYDMEDAMILNKSSVERGFASGFVYKSEMFDLSAGRHKGGIFGIGNDISIQDKRRGNINEDGLPSIGSKIKAGDAICAFKDPSSGSTRFESYKGTENCIVDQVRVIGGNNSKQAFNKVHIKLRINRSPAIGDKFASRHGQKGVCSQIYPAVDMPFTESGMQPDIIINPHAFPSRMTIGMLIEMMAGKSGSLHGIKQDSTPFTFSESDTPAEYCGEQLLKAGYNYHGNEPMYSGVTGKEFRADIFFGACYYQRLKHMVSDKWQVRTTGPVEKVTQQPVHGRKKGGGVRFGEMERDALLAHGTSFLLQDRLLNCSDYSIAWVCKQCGRMSTIGYKDTQFGLHIERSDRHYVLGPSGEYCRICTKESNHMAKSGPNIVAIAIPFVFRYLVAELASMGIDIKIMPDTFQNK